ncbi:DUF7833 domain-containing protein [Sphingobacterium sp. LRF_L2]|uniref:DUF7833 domain-containing protein n=1 Tax=Sphingobacterium sp. LRF_L2 TaxID=3369421 RepID=UPI003F62F7FE
MASLGYTWYPKDFISDPDVMFMTAAERGVYRDLIDLAYTSENRIAYSIDMLARYTNSDVQTVEKILSMKAQKKGDFWTIPSCGKRIDLINKNRSNGSKGGRPKTQTKPKQNPTRNKSENPKETQTQRQIEIESKIESKNNTPTSYYGSDVDDGEKSNRTPIDLSNIGEHPIEKLKQKFEHAQTWFDQVGMKNSIEPNDVGKWFEKFCTHCLAQGKEKMTEKDFKSYFANWVTIRIESGEVLHKKKNDQPDRFILGAKPMGAVKHG